MTEPTNEQREFVLSQHELYGALADRVVDIRKALDGGTDLADVLTDEMRMVLDSGMIREQIAAALVSVLARVAQGEDMSAPEQVGAARETYWSAVMAGRVGLPPIRRGGIRFPIAEV